MKRNGSAAVKSINRAAPRYRFEPSEKARIRFLCASQRKILVTRIFDISETGISFMTTRRVAPLIGEILKMEFAPLGGMQIACLGKVIRIEEPNKRPHWHNTGWEKFPTLIKVGVQFYRLPKPYSKLISRGLKVAFESKAPQAAHEIIEIRSGSISQAAHASYDAFEQWLVDNWFTFLMSLIITASFGVGIYWLMTNPNVPRDEVKAPWAQKFFQKMKDTNEGF